MFFVLLLSCLLLSLRVSSRTLSSRTPPSVKTIRKGTVSRQTHPSSRDLCLLLEQGLANVGAAELDLKDTLHSAQDLLVRGGGAALKVGDDGRGRVAACREVLLGHLGLLGLPRLGDDGADLLADRRGLDDVVAAVDLGQALAFDAGLGGLCLNG